MARFARGNPAKWWRSRTVGLGTRSPAAMFISPFRRYASASFLVILLLVIGGVWYLTHPKRISAMAQVLLSNVLGGDVEVKSGEVSWAGTLQLSDVTLSTGEGANKLPLFTADQLEVRFNWISLLVGQLRATQITAIRPTLHLIEDPVTQRWNYQRLGGAQSGSSGEAGAASPPQLPVIMLRDARVEWGEATAGKIVRTGAAVVDGQLTPDPALPTLFRFSMIQRGGLAVGQSEVTGSWDVLNNRFTAVTNDIQLSDSLKRSMPRSVRQWWDEHALTGRLAHLRLTHEEGDGLVLVTELDGVSVTLEVPAAEAMNAKPQILPFKKVRGLLTFGISRGFVRVSNLRGEVIGQQFQVDGEFRGLAPESPFDLTVKLTNASIKEPYPDMLMGHAAGQDLLQRVRPFGRFDLSLGIKRVTVNGMMHVNGEVQLKDLAIRFAHFAYPLEKMRGKITFDNERVYFHNVSAIADEAPVRLNGFAGVTHDSPAFDVIVSSDDATFDDRFAACLPEKYAQVWERLDFMGKGKFSARVSRPNDHNATYSVVVDVTLRDGSGEYQDFPYPLKNVTGHLKIEGDKTTLDNLTAKTGEQTIAINGVLHHLGGDLENLQPDFTIAARSLNITDDLINLLPYEQRGWAKHVEVGGLLDADVTLKHRDLAATVKYSKGSIKARDNSLTLTDATLAAAINNEGIRIDSAQAKLQESTLNLAGTYTFETGKFALDVAANLKDFKLSPMPAFLPTAQQSLWKQYNPAGAVDGSIEVKLDGDAAMLAPDAKSATNPVKHYTANLKLADVSLTPKDWPDALTAINGAVEVTPTLIQMRNMTAAAGPAKLQWQGSYDLAKGGLNVGGKAVADQLPLKWTKLFPASVNQFFEKAKPEGQLVILLDKLERRSLPGGPATQPADNWTFSGSISLSTIKSPTTLNMEAQEILVTGVGAWKSDSPMFDFAGSLAAKSVTFSGREIETLTSKITAGTRQNTRAIRVEELDGKVAGGAVQGSVIITIDPAPRYEANVVLSDAELATLALGPKATEQEKKQIGTGRVTASLAVQEDFSGNAGRTGRGDLVVRDGAIYNVPLAMGLMQIATLRLPVSSAFDQATMSYFLRDNKVTFERILLESKGINLAGSGTLSLKDYGLDMHFVTESPNELRIPIISPIIRGARNEILQIQVTGTTDNPRVQPVPMSAITQTLQALLPKRKRDNDK